MYKKTFFTVILIFISLSNQVVFAVPQKGTTPLQGADTATTQAPEKDPLFDKSILGDTPLCTRGPNSDGGYIVTCDHKVLGSPCEIVTRALQDLDRSNELQDLPQGGSNSLGLSHYACAEFVDPVPAAFFGSDTFGMNYCVTLGDTTNTSYSYNFSRNTGDNKQYCSAILHPTGDINIIFGFVLFIYDLALPFLVTAAVIAMVITGIMMMYSGSSEEAAKNSRALLVRVGAGLALLFTIKIILSTIDSTFFVVGDQPTYSTTTSSTGSSAEGTFTPKQ